MPYAVISGVSSGIGLDATRILIENGFHVFGTVRKDSDKESLLNQFPDHLDVLMMDVTDDEAIEAGRKFVKESIGDETIKVLMNNAGIAVPGPLMLMSDEEFYHQINVNVLAVRKFTNAFLPMLGFQEDFPHTPGKIINISSVSGLFNNPFNGAYSISKHALESMNDVYRRELLKFGIDVIAIEPGPIKTKIWNKNIGGLDKYKDSMYGDLLKKADKMIEQAEAGALPVEDVSNLILKIVQSDKPKTRYIVHKKPLLFKIFSKWLPDRMQDRLVWKTLNKKDGKYRPV
ncbi:MAG: SDR family NAD(P)-dependent oxidoreductase [Saprospiraceae bacterium]|nr:SDR family NAD(P)-dependent oxidoreductase [Saprospiraceae bacterium]